MNVIVREVYGGCVECVKVTDRKKMGFYSFHALFFNGAGLEKRGLHPAISCLLLCGL